MSWFNSVRRYAANPLADLVPGAQHNVRRHSIDKHALGRFGTTNNCDPQSFGATGLPISLQDPIPIVVNGALKRKDNEKIGAERPVKRVKLDSKKKRKGGGIAASKRKGDDDIDERKLAKRARTRQRKAQEGASKSANKQPASRPTTRRTRAGNR
ncbi:hypothetical protein DFH09DRAFT_1093859 [Mycena vulgaris]|nr:hypothetical protein DFH09DRAFT_1093859 [Mycena vulgaris]